MPQLFKRRLLKYLPLLKLILIVLVFSILFSYIWSNFSPIYNFAKKNNISPKFISDLILNKKLSLKNYQGRTNIIILGIGGGNHEGSDLTDSILFLSLDRDKNNAVILSIPRDLWTPSLKDRINTAYHYGEEKKKGGGIILAKSTVEEIIQLPVHYALLIDFSGFKKIIDKVGGLNINIEKGFDDNSYPIVGKENDFCGGDPTFACRYEKIHFDSGLQQMDGDRALKYVRSRHAEGDEGNDFSRSKRQQQVILALKDKVIKTNILKDPEKIKEFIKLIDNTIISDMDWSEKISFFKSFTDLPDNNIKHLVLDTGDKEKKKPGFLINPPAWEYNGAWVLVPRTGNFQEIQQYVACYLNNTNCLFNP